MKYHSSFLLLVFFLIQSMGASKVMAQIDTARFIALIGEATALDKAGEFDASIAKLTESFEYAAANGGEHYALRYSLTRRCVAYNRYNRMEEFWNDIQLGKQLAEEYSDYLPEGIQDNMTIFFKNEEGHFHYRRGELGKADVSFKKLVSDLLENKPADSSALGNAYEHLGMIHVDQNNLATGLIYLEQSMSYLSSQDKGGTGEVVLLMHLANAHKKMQNPKRAKPLYEKAIHLLGNQKLTDRQQLNRYSSTVRSYAKFLLEQGDPVTAKNLVLNSLSKYTPSDPQYIQSYLFLGEISEALNQPDQAADYYQKSLLLNKKAVDNQSAANALIAMASLQANKGDITVALASLQSALVQLNDRFNSKEWCDNPTSLSENRSWQLLLKILKTKANLLTILSQNDSQLYSCAENTYRLANDLLNKMRAINVDPSDRLTLNEDNYQLFEAGMQLYASGPATNAEAAFLVSEQSKANTLITAINKSYIQGFNVPEEVLRKQANLQEQLRNALSELENKSGDKVEESRRLVTELTLKLDALTDRLKADYPDYYNLRFSQRVDDLATVRNRLEHDELLVTFFMGEKAAYAIAISKTDTPSVYRLTASPQDVAKAVDKFRHSLLDFSPASNNDIGFKREYASEREANIGYVKEANWLFKVLLGQFKDKLDQANKLTIIPDGELSYLPFDALLTDDVASANIEKQDWSAYPFLGKQLYASYCYSATMLGLMQENQIEPTSESGLLVFHLDQFSAQINQLEQAMDGFNLNILNQEATREAYLAEAANYPMLHFSVHGIVNDQSPSSSYFELRPQTDETEPYLLLSDIYSKPLNASFVFASACEAGLGSLKKGEGLLSLTRGFAYAGAKSMVTTIWPVMNGSSVELVGNFYRNLQSGMTKDASLSEAKRSLMYDPTLGHPYFWAGFVPVGDMEAISGNSFHFGWGVIGVGALFLVGLLMYFRK